MKFPSVAAIVLIGSNAGAVSVPFEWSIATKGTGPGTVMEMATVDVELKDWGPCWECPKLDTTKPNCIERIGDYETSITGLVSVPEGETNLLVVFSGGSMFRSVGNWQYMVTGPVCGDCQVCPYVCGGGTLGSGDSPSGSFVARIPWAGNYRIRIGIQEMLGNCSAFVCGPGSGACHVAGCCGAMPDAWSMTVFYKKQSATAPKECVDGGDGHLEATAAWYPVASGSCMTAPDVAESWSGHANITEKNEANIDLDSRMVADLGAPDGPSGSLLIARAGCRVFGTMVPPVPLTIRGEVLDYAVGHPPKPIPGARVVAVCETTRVSCVTDMAGRFTFSVPEGGTYAVTASAIGFGTVTKQVEVSGEPECTGVLGFKLRAGCSSPVPKGMVRIAGSVMNAKNMRAEAGADVAAVGSGGGVWSAKSDAEASYSMLVPTGQTYKITAVKGLLASEPVFVSPEVSEGVCEVRVDLTVSCRDCSQPVDYRYQCDGTWCCRNLNCVGQDLCDCATVNCVEKKETCPSSSCSSRSFCGAGCLLMCVSMIADRDPVALNRELTLEGIIDSGGDMNLWDAAVHLGFSSVTPLGYDPGTLAPLLCDPGLAVIAEIPTAQGHHYVVVTRIEADDYGDCQFRVSNPGSLHAKPYLSSYVVSKLLVICKSECIGD